MPMFRQSMSAVKGPTCVHAAHEMSEPAVAAVAAPLVFKKMYGQCWEAAVGKTIYGQTTQTADAAAAAGDAVQLGRVCAVKFSNFDGPFLVYVDFEGGRRAHYLFGRESPLFAVE